jgi:hypothetical protein
MAMNSFLFLKSDVVPDPGLGPRRGFVVVSGLFLEVVDSFGDRLLGSNFLFDTSNLSICALQKTQTSRPGGLLWSSIRYNPAYYYVRPTHGNLAELAADLGLG